MRKNMLNFIETLNPNNIDCFWASNDQCKVVMVMKDGEEVEFPINTGYGVFAFYTLTEKISGEKEELKSVRSNANSYIYAANSAMNLNKIKRILVDAGSNANPSEIKSIMLDGVKHTNLFTLAEQENNLKKYVLIALELLNKLNGDVNKIYKKQFRKRVLKVGVVNE